MAVILPNRGMRRPSSCAWSCLLGGASWLRTTSDSKKDCGSAMRTGMASRKIAMANSFRSTFILLFQSASQWLYAPVECTVTLRWVRSNSLPLQGAVTKFQLDFPPQRHKVPEGTRGGHLSYSQ